MSTPLTVYGSNILSSTLPTAAKLLTATGGSTGNRIALIGNATGWGELYGNAGAWAAAGAMGGPTGNGFLFDFADLEGNQLLAGPYTPTLRLQVRTGDGNVTADLYVNAYLFNPAGGGIGQYTLIGTSTLAAQTVTSVLANYVLAAADFPGWPFIGGGSGDKLYFDVWPNILTNTNTLATAALNAIVSTSSTLGAAVGFNVVTPGYQPTPALVDGHIGVTIGAYSATETMDTQTPLDCADVGITWVRVNSWLDKVDASSGPNHTFLWSSGLADGITWSGLDNYVRQCNLAGLNVTLPLKKPPGHESVGTAGTGSWGCVSTVCGINTYAVGGVDGPASTWSYWHQPTAAYMVKAATAYATRYDGKHGHGQIQSIEILNEDGDEYYCTHCGSNQTCRTYNWYAPILGPVSDAIKAANPACKVGFFGFLWCAQPHVTNFMNGMYLGDQGPSCFGKVDFYNFHYYRPQADQLVDILNQPYSGWTKPSYPNMWGGIHAANVAGGEPNARIWNTEIGFDATGSTLSEATLELYWKEDLDSARNSIYVEKIFIYTVRYDTKGGHDTIVSSDHNRANYPAIYAWLKNYFAVNTVWASDTVVVPPPPPPPPPGPPPPVPPPVVPPPPFVPPPHGQVGLTPNQTAISAEGDEMPIEVYNSPDQTIVTGSLTVKRSNRYNNTGVNMDDGLLVSDGFGTLIGDTFIGGSFVVAGQNMNLSSIDEGGTPLQVMGAIATAVTTKTAAYTLTPSDSLLLGDATGGAFAVTLPDATSCTGRNYKVKKIDSSGNAVTVGTTASQKIDGASTSVLSSQYTSVDVISDGANWFKV